MGGLLLVNILYDDISGMDVFEELVGKSNILHLMSNQNHHAVTSL
jgi:hypothetical protein